MKPRTLLIMAGGTGGHIMPGLAVAQEMKTRGWQVLWLGHPQHMEGRLVPAQGIELEPLYFGGVRGKGVAALLKLPLTLASACWQALGSLKKIRPDVVLGMGGYVAFPGGLMAALRRIPLVIHEQNAVAGTANRWLAKIANQVLVGFPGALPDAIMVGNPVRQRLAEVAAAEQRYGSRQGPLRLLVVGGSLGSQTLNKVIPFALAQLAPDERPVVVHQTGERHLNQVRAAYEQVGVPAQCHAFIDDMAGSLANADLLICRAGAMTVAEVAAVGVAALFIPLLNAIDDHQTANARYLSDCKGAWLKNQKEFSADWLAQWMRERTRTELALVAQHAHEHARLNATQQIADACEQALEMPA
ncbi:undecaprenyldiphospho-muramoylpentapeptide beta-N-acetylglucosaminyltransferase [Paralcaligenes ureilyticus]|uniref:UDP-N-acetylglucosamine--N-acetylmuramyl-(pentapeptide) pyrophosphoryl-undecaprenol N-acetylglucosamine transferase n=1 Tax=Paralcaligenes ureilyticus TaxID=627131 RepID=A0A4R3MAW1_9BURK|nr:undecaprenyldiphospho-muramoylpentapeptide beta-N-acetylglucosaminyltransferase [Paralcaligenes ureilyticus]TCT09399.1 UDP-N-acetylglucosamine-N-acetylmuramylpentapeptide N-acetylglucosamine transferase [Paralcaligenes ureilyticus]